MKEKESDDFKIDLDEENPDSIFQEEMEDIKIEKLSQRVTLISILIPCLIVVILFVAYMDIKNRVIRVHNTGTVEVKNLSEDVEGRLSALSLKYAKIEDSFEKKIISLEKKASTIADKLNKTAKDVGRLSLLKTDKKELERNLKKIEQELTPIRSDLKNISPRIKTIENKFGNEIIKFTEAFDNLKNNFKGLEKNIETLSSAQINKAKLDLALSNEQKNYLKKLNQMERNLEDDIEFLRLKIKNLEKISKLSKEEKQIKSGPPPTSSQPLFKESLEAKSPKDEDIFEHDIHD